MVKKQLWNPFVLAGFYGKQYFCRQEKEILKLGEFFENERNVVLFSWIGLGKTALLQYFMATLEKEKRAETVYIDLRGTREMQSAIRNIAKSVTTRFGLPNSGMLNSLEDIGEFLSNRQMRILLVIDNFQHVTHYSDENGEALFHEWMKAYPGIRFFYSGSPSQKMISMFTLKSKPFYLSAQLLQINAIEESHYLKFIRSHFHTGGKTIDKAVLKAIFKWSRMQTYCIQILCNELYGRYNQVGIGEFEQVIDEILLRQGALFSGYTRLLTGMQWKVLKAVAVEEPLRNPLSKDFIRKHDLGASSSVSTALEMLQKSELVTMEEGAYYIHEVLLLRWLQTL